jgi:hypothetical protein
VQITLDITAKAQAELSRQAAVSGHDPEQHAASLLEEALHTTSARPFINGGEPLLGKRLVDAFAMIRGLADDVDFSRDRTPDRPVDFL